MVDAQTSLLENMVAVNLIRNYGKRDNVFFYHNNVEVDFYVSDMQQAYQVSYSLSDKDTRCREINALKKINKVLPVKEFFIITYDEEELVVEGDLIINVIPIWKWLIS